MLTATETHLFLNWIDKLSMRQLIQFHNKISVHSAFHQGTIGLVQTEQRNQLPTEINPDSLYSCPKLWRVATVQRVHRIAFWLKRSNIVFWGFVLTRSDIAFWNFGLTRSDVVFWDFWLTRSDVVFWDFRLTRSDIVFWDFGLTRSDVVFWDFGLTTSDNVIWDSSPYRQAVQKRPEPLTEWSVLLKCFLY